MKTRAKEILEKVEKSEAKIGNSGVGRVSVDSEIGFFMTLDAYYSTLSKKSVMSVNFGFGNANPEFTPPAGLDFSDDKVKDKFLKDLAKTLKPVVDKFEKDFKNALAQHGASVD